MSIVTKDIQKARRIVCSGTRTARYVKHRAHRRHRAHQREALHAIVSGQLDADEADFVSQPGTGWDVA